MTLTDSIDEGAFKDEQHFVSQFYLRGFSISGHKSLLWEFDKEECRFTSRPRSVRKVCKRYRYYEQVDADGKFHPDRLERGFDKIVENRAAKLLRSITPKNSGDTVPLVPWDQGSLAYYTASQYTRVPNFRGKIETIMRIRIEREFDKLVKQQRSNGTLPPKVDALLRKSRPELTIEKWGTIRPMLNAAQTVGEALLRKTPAFFLPAPGMSFITSDNPVTYYVKNWEEETDPMKLEPVHPSAEVLFPLRKDLALVYFPIFNPDWNQRVVLHVRCLALSSDLTRYLNTQTALFADRYLYMAQRDNSLFDTPS